MSLYDRAAQFSSYKALSGFEDMIAEEARLTDREIKLEDHDLDVLNQKLYFEPNIRAVQSDSSFEWYRNYERALAKNNSSDDIDTPENRVLKVITAIGVINDASTPGIKQRQHVHKKS